MGEALAMNPEKLAFIHGDKNTAEVGQGPDKGEPTDRAAPEARDADREEPVASGRRIKRRGPRPKETEPLAVPMSHETTDAGVLPPLLVSLTTRLSPTTAEALRRASLEQRLRRRRPHTQQEIVESAVRKWLTTNGFLRAV